MIASNKLSKPTTDHLDLAKEQFIMAHIFWFIDQILCWNRMYDWVMTISNFHSKAELTTSATSLTRCENCPRYAKARKTIAKQVD